MANSRVAEDFRLSAPVTGATSLCWWGSYTNGTCAQTFPDDFRVTYYLDGGGVPGMIAGGPFSQSGGSLLVSRATTGLTVAGSPEYEYSATHAPVGFLANQCYWVEITNGGSTPVLCNWFWEYSSVVNNRILADNNNNYETSDQVARDMAFCLAAPLGDATICSSTAPPSNNACGNALPIVCGTPVSVDNTNATTTITDPQLPCRAGAATQGVGTIWFSFVAASSTAQISTCGSIAANTLLAVYSGTCGALTQIACNDDAAGCGANNQHASLCVNNLTPGATYLIEAASYNSVSRGTITLALQCSCGSQCIEPAANCQAFGAENAVASTAFFRSADDFRPAANGQISHVCAWGIYSENTPNSPDSFTIRYYAAGAGSVPGALLASYSQSLGTLTLLDRTDTGSDLASAFDIYEYTFSHAPLAVSAATCYWIEIRSESTPRTWFWVFSQPGAGNGRRLQDVTQDGALGIDDSGAGDLAFCLSVTLDDAHACLPPVPANTSCLTAAALPCNPGGPALRIDNTLSDAIADPPFTCSSGGMGALWYSFVATQPSVRISTCNSNSFGDAMLAVYTGDCTNALAQIACVDDNCGAGGTMSEIVLNNAQVGATHYIQFASFGLLDQGVYKLKVSCTGEGCTGLLVGDSNGDYLVNNFDVDAFILALLDPVAYENIYGPNTLVCENDVNRDGLMNNFDVDAFVNCLLHPPAPGQSCP